MSVSRQAAGRAGGHYRRVLGRHHPVLAIEAEAHHLHEIEERGESGATPLITLLGVAMFLLPILALMMGIAFAAYYLS